MLFGDNNPELERSGAAETMGRRLFIIDSAIYKLENNSDTAEVTSQPAPVVQPELENTVVVDFEDLKQQKLDEKIAQAAAQDVRLHEARKNVDRAEAA